MFRESMENPWDFPVDMNEIIAYQLSIWTGIKTSTDNGSVLYLMIQVVRYSPQESMKGEVLNILLNCWIKLMKISIMFDRSEK